MREAKAAPTRELGSWLGSRPLLPFLSPCCRHHHLKHDAGWTPWRLEDGSIEWTSPTGHKYVEPQATYPIDRTSELSEPPGPGERSGTDPDPPF
jgi:hypothetical protein